MRDIEQIIDLLKNNDPRGIARAITIVENGELGADRILASLDQNLIDDSLILGITGPPGAGKSTLTDAFVSVCRKQGKKVGVIAVDPSSPVTGGAILGDRVRMMQHAIDPEVIMRSMATRGRLGGICGAAGAAVRILASSGCSIIIIETVGVGQSEIDVIRLADLTIMTLAPGLGDDIQAMKAGILEVVDLIVVNKADNPGADSVAMDMEAVLRERFDPDHRPVKVCLTVASEGKGVDELFEQVDTLNQQLRVNGEYIKRREIAQQVEILDWAVEMLRPRLMEKISNDFRSLSSDPKLQAKKLVDLLTF